FDVADDSDTAHVGSAKDAIVANLLNAGTGLGNNRGELCEAAGAVADGGDKPGQAAIGGEANFDHAAQDERVDIATAEQDGDGTAFELGQLAAQQRGERRSAGALDDALFQLDQAQDSEGYQLFGDSESAIDAGL